MMDEASREAAPGQLSCTAWTWPKWRKAKSIYRKGGNAEAPAPRDSILTSTASWLQLAWLPCLSGKFALLKDAGLASTAGGGSALRCLCRCGGRPDTGEAASITEARGTFGEEGRRAP
eukprot:scaffold1635_cov229-Pinguiococcus_pyrenoidosus.AAC.2